MKIRLPAIFGEKAWLWIGAIIGISAIVAIVVLQNYYFQSPKGIAESTDGKKAETPVQIENETEIATTTSIDSNGSNSTGGTEEDDATMPATKETPVQIENETAAQTTVTAFKVKEVYPTKPGGREWFINMNNPAGDGIFDPRTRLSRQLDGSWLVSGADNGKYQVRMDVGTPPGQQEWLNVEITGYIKVLDSTSLDNTIDWYARGGLHTSSAPCEGTSLKGKLHLDGTAEWIKEIWHAGGYTDARAQANATSSIMGRWIGWKVAIYNIENNTAVKMESYIDDKADNNWKKVTEYIDNGNWFAGSSDKEFYSAGCGKAKDYIITNPGPIVTFRSDDVIWQFRDLSVREIQAPQQ